MTQQRRSTSSATNGARGSKGRLPTQLRNICERVRSLFASATTAEVETRYRIGGLLLRVKRAPGTYGEGAVECLEPSSAIPIDTRGGATYFAEHVWVSVGYDLGEEHPLAG
jgi:hypothetical protein